MVMEDFEIRPAAEDDVPHILQFIKKLAEYERLSQEVVATEETLRETLFGERRTAEVIIGEYRHEPVAVALFFHSYSTFLGKQGIYLEDLYVNEECRGYGFGFALLRYIARLAKDRKCGRLEWAVLDWNEPAIQFYEKLGAVAMSDWTVYRLSGEALDRLADASNLEDGANHI